MSLLRGLQLFYSNRLRGGAERVAAATLLLVANLAAPASAPGFLPPSFEGRPWPPQRSGVGGAGGVRSSAPLAPQGGCGVVTNNTDNASGSLRWTVGCVAAGATVTFLASLAGQTIVLTGTEIAITKTITVDGSGAPGVIVDAGNASRVFNITASGPVTLTALTLQHGSSDVGGAVFDNVSQPLVLNSVRVLSSTVNGGTGGGLFADGPLTLNNSDFISDTSTSNGGGVVAVGAAVVTGGRFERDTCTTGGCEGGALFGFASLTVNGTQFVSNTSHFHGGAAYTSANAVLTNGSFQGNKCSQSGCQGGGLYANATLTMTGAQFISNTSISDGGAGWAKDAALTGGSFQGNKCTDTVNSCSGGGLAVSDVLTVTSTDFISNTASGSGGGARAAHGATLTGGRFERNTCLQNNGCTGGGLDTEGTLTLIGTDFISNTSTSYGGGAWAANAALTNGSFQGNKCTGDFCEGGGLFADGTLILTGTDFISNTSTSDGGGAYAFEAAFTGGDFQGNHCSPVTVPDCYGGGVYSNDQLVVTGTRFIGNTSTSDGGGAWGYDALLTGTSFEGNRCTAAGCQGGGLFADDLARVTSSSFSGNHSAGLGGALVISGSAPLTLANVTLSGNSAASGGGLYLGGASRANLYNVTIAGNQAASGGGLFVEPGATLRVTNTIIANNTADNCAGTVAGGTHNLEFPGPAACATAGPTAGFTTADPLLAPLALNAPGTTLTQALLPNSAARDHGDPLSCANALVNNLDQRGVIRPDAGGEACDIGAYEAGPPDWLVFLSLIRK